MCIHTYIVQKEGSRKSFCHLNIQVYQKYINMIGYLLRLESFRRNKFVMT